MSNIQKSITSILQERNTRRHLAVVVCMVAVAMALAVFWSLHINGITLTSGDLTCGMEEHTHTSDCYAWVLAEDGTEEITELEETEESSEAETVSGTEESTETDSVSETEDGTETDSDSETEEDTETETDSEIEAVGKTVAGSTEAVSETATESSTESVSTEDGTEALTVDGTEALTENGSEALTEEETEIAQVGDTKLIDGVEYVYTLICGMEEHVHTDACYASDDSEETETEETASASSLNAGIATLGITRLGSSGPSAGVSAASLEEDDNGISTASDEPTGTTSTASSSDPSDYNLANTVYGQPSSGTYIVYTYDSKYGIYYVLEKDGSLTACKTISSITEATGDGPYYVTGTGTIVYGSTDAGTKAYEAAQWTVTQESSDSSAYTIVDSSTTSSYLTPTGTSSDVTISDYESASTEGVELSGDFTLTYTFMNTGDSENSGENWNNFIVKIQNGRGVDIYVRADNYGWLSKTANSSDTLEVGNGASDWSSWLSTMTAGAVCTVTVTRSGNVFTIICEAAGETFTATANMAANDFGTTATVCLTGEYCTISDIIYTYTDSSATGKGSNLDSTVSTLVSSSYGFVTITSAGTSSADITLSRSAIAAVETDAASASETASAAWVSYGTGSVFRLAAVSTSDAYYFADSITLANAAASQGDSYIVYTQIGGVYYLVSAVDGSLLECTDLDTGTGYTDAQKALLSESVGVYIWDYDDSSEPVFKFTESADGEFDDYRWTLSSSDANATTGDGTYTIYNSKNSDYLAYAQSGTESLSSGDASGGNSISNYGTVEYTITVDAGVSNYAQFTIYTSPGKYSKRYVGVSTPYVELGTEWSAAGGCAAYGANLTYTGYGMGTMTLHEDDVLTVTVTVSVYNVIYDFYNNTTGENYVYYVDTSSSNNNDYRFSYTNNGSITYIYSNYGEYTISSLTALYSSSTSTLASGSYDLTSVPDVTEVDATSKSTRLYLSGDYDITYSFSLTGDSVTSLDEVLRLRVENGEDANQDGTIDSVIDDNVYIDIGFSGGTSYGTNAATVYTNTSYNDGGTALLAAINSGATCTVRVIRAGNDFFFSLSATYDSVTYTLYGTTTASDFNDYGTVTYLMGKGCTIRAVSYTNNTHADFPTATYKRLASGRTKSYLTISGTAYDWTAVSNSYSLIAQLATDSAQSAEIDWVTATTTGGTATGTATTTLSGVTVANLAADGSLTTTFSLARVREYKVYFDPTDGNVNYGTTSTETSQFYTDADTLYGYTRYGQTLTTYSDYTGNCYVNLPYATYRSAGNGDTGVSNFVLQGWYDIYGYNNATNKTYAPSVTTGNSYYSCYDSSADREYWDYTTWQYSTIQIVASTVFYGDWGVSSYDIAKGTESGALADASTGTNTGTNGYGLGGVSTSSFITIDVFDYSDLFNLYSTNMYSDGTTYLTSSGHAETWYITQWSDKSILGSPSLGFAFIASGSGSLLSRPARNYYGNNSLINTQNSSNNERTAEIIENKVTSGTYTSSTLEHIGTGKGLFLKVNSDGLYEVSSLAYEYSYNGVSVVTTYSTIEADSGNNIEDLGLTAAEKETVNSSGSHVLNMYYLERGAGQSNLTVAANLSPSYGLKMGKVDKNDTDTSLVGTKFTFYDVTTYLDETDFGVSTVLQSIKDGTSSTYEATALYPSYTSSTAQATYTITCYCDSSGCTCSNCDCSSSGSTTCECDCDACEAYLQLYGLRQGHTYYIVETKTPDGYPTDIADYAVLKLEVGTDGSMTLTIMEYDTTTGTWVEGTSYYIDSNGDCVGTSGTDTDYDWYVVYTNLRYK